MLKVYFSFIKNLFDSIVGSSHDVVTVTDYFKAIGFGMGTVFCIVLFIVIIVALFLIPIKGFDVFAKKEFAKVDELLQKEEREIKEEEVEAISTRIRFKGITYIVFLILIYLPFAIPTALFILDQLLRIF